MLIDYKMYRSLYTEAKEYDDIEQYVAERDWTGTEESDRILREVYAISRQGIKKLLAVSSCTQAEFAKLYQIPKRKIYNWSMGARTPSEWVVVALGYAVINRKSV